MKEWARMIFVVIVGILAGDRLHECQRIHDNPEDMTEFVSDTTSVQDTIPYTSPVPKSEIALGTRTYTLPKYYFIGLGAGGEPRCCNDTCSNSLADQNYCGTGAGGEPRCCDDSMTIELPTIQRHYEDSTYEAWVSGPIDPQLDSLRVFVPTTIITKREREPPKRWHIGPTIGYGITPDGLRPFVGVSITYSIISW